jgi:drug/metabolite transporter (DMT)-like permease
LSAEPNRHLAGIVLMSVAVLMFSLNDVLGKWLVATYSVAQVLVLRSIAALAVLAVLLPRDGGVAALLRPRRRRLQALRVACGTLEVGAFYWAVSMMPLADTMAFWMAMPIFVAVAGALLLGERLEPARLAAVAIGFLGVLLALGAGLDSGWLPCLVAVAGVVLYSGYLLCTRALRTTPAAVLAVYQMLGALLFGLVLLPFGWVTPSWADVGLLMLLGVVGVGAHLAVTQSLVYAPASVVTPWQYAMILWAILFGWIFFAEVPGPTMLIGVAVIVAAGLWLTRLEMRAARAAA